MKWKSVILIKHVYQVILYLLYLRRLSFNCGKYMTIFFRCPNFEDIEMLWSCFSDVEFYVINSLYLINMYVLQILYIILNGKWVNDVWIRRIIKNLYILQFVALEKVLEKTSVVLLVFISITINPAQVLQRKNINTLVGVPFTVQIYQINTLSYVLDFDLICR